MSTTTQCNNLKRVDLAPVMIEIEQKCAWLAKPCGRCGKAKSNKVHRKTGGTCKFKAQRGCARCGKIQAHRDHFGSPPSLNVLGSGNPGLYIGLKQSWERILTEVLEESELPKGLASVMVEGEVSYRTKSARDHDNGSALFKKYLGDALKRGGWLAEDDVWSRYQCADLRLSEEQGISCVRLWIFPSYSVLPG